MPCLDQDQNAVDCSDPNCTYGDCNAQSEAASAQLDMGVTPSWPAFNNPISAGAGSSNGNGGTSLSSFFAGLGTVTTNIIGKSTGVPTAKPYQPPLATSVFGGSSSSGILLLVAAVVVAFLAFGGRKRLFA